MSSGHALMDARARMGEQGLEVDAYAVIGAEHEPCRTACSIEHLAVLLASEQEIAAPMPAAIMGGQIVPLTPGEFEQLGDAMGKP